MLEGSVPWSVESVAGQRLEFCRLVELGGDVPFVELCRRFGIAPKTGYKWLSRFRLEGAEGLGDRSRAPRSSPLATSAEMVDLVIGIRAAHPRWGGRKIRRRLMDLGHSGVPAPSTISDIVRRHGLMAVPVSQSGGFTRFTADAPNDLWQMDFKGWIDTGAGRCDPFDVLDDHSRYSLWLSAEHDQTETTVKAGLTAAFETFGMPLRILCDNGSPWGNTQPGFRWTSLTVWLLDLGIGVAHSRPFHPQTLGKDERFHRTMDLEVISTRTRWDSHQQLQEAFDRWRIVYNHQRPHDALNLDTPADRYQPSPRSMPALIVPVEYPDGYQVRNVDTNARISFKGTIYKIGKPFAGRKVGVVPTTTDGIFHVHYRQHHIRTLDMTQ